MYCKNCGAAVKDGQAVCTNCGFRVGDGTKFCANCGTETAPGQAVCVKCGNNLGGKLPGSNDQKDWTVSLLLSIFLGELGIDRFYMGYTGLGILKLLTLGGCGIWWLIDVILIATNGLTDAQGRPLVKS
jgi:hypothetical protein